MLLLLVLQIAIRAVESDSATLDLALHMCAAVHQGLGTIQDAELRASLTNKLELRFAQYNQPAMVLAYFLNPARQTRAPLNDFGDLTSTANLIILGRDLYAQLFPHSTPADQAAVSEQMLLYIERKKPFQIGKCCNQILPAMWSAAA